MHGVRASATLHERTGDIQLVQKMLGHSSPTITAAIYSGIRDAYARESVNKLRLIIHRTETVVAIGLGAENDRSTKFSRFNLPLETEGE
jgi:hypothetical protein